MVPTRILRVILRQHRACYLDLHRATARERYELLLQRCPGTVEHLALQDLASFLRPFGSKRQSRAPLHHAADALPNPQKHLFRSTKIVFLQKFTENSFRVSPPTTAFRSCRELFRTFFLTLHKKIAIRGLVNRFSCVLRVYDRSK